MHKFTGLQCMANLLSAQLVLLFNLVVLIFSENLRTCTLSFAFHNK